VALKCNLGDKRWYLPEKPSANNRNREQQQHSRTCQIFFHTGQPSGVTWLTLMLFSTSATRPYM